MAKKSRWSKFTDAEIKELSVGLSTSFSEGMEINIVVASSLGNELHAEIESRKALKWGQVTEESGFTRRPMNGI